MLLSMIQNELNYPNKIISITFTIKKPLNNLKISLKLFKSV